MMSINFPLRLFCLAIGATMACGGATTPDRITLGKMLAVIVVGTGALHIWSSPVRIGAARSTFRWLLALCLVSAFSTLWSYAPLDTVRFAAQMFLQLALAWVIVTLIAPDRAYLQRLMFWTVLGVAGGLPIYLSGVYDISITDAVFESISGITTTGATVIVGIDELDLLNKRRDSSSNGNQAQDLDS